MDNIKLCPICNKNRIDWYYNDVIIRDERICFDCFKDMNVQTPYFINHIPAFTEGMPYKIFEFSEQYQLIEYLTKNSIPNDNILLVKSPDSTHIMNQSISKSFWWVLGNVINYDMKMIDLPTWNPQIYNPDESVNNEKLKHWLSDI
jgi:hypothetical protein